MHLFFRIPGRVLHWQPPNLHIFHTDPSLVCIVLSLFQIDQKRNSHVMVSDCLVLSLVHTGLKYMTSLIGLESKCTVVNCRVIKNLKQKYCAFAKVFYFHQF